MHEFFNNLIKNNSCTSGGACSIHPSVNSIYQLVLYQIRELSFYLIKLNEFNIQNKEITNNVILALSTFFINTNFNKTKFLKFYEKLDNEKKQAKQKYVEYCKNHDISYETISSLIEINKDYTLDDLIKYAQNNIINKQAKEDKQKANLFELITIFSKLVCLNIQKIKCFENDFDEYDLEVIRFFSLTNSFSIRKEKLIRRIKEFSNISRKVQQKLAQIYYQEFGQKEDASISFDVENGHNILVSGNDLFELKKVLETIEKSKLKNINVYTNGPLFMAHFYQYFKNNKFLKGHFGKNEPEYDFSTFEGVILITRNFIQKIDSLYKGEIFSNKLVSFDRVIDIKDNNYTPLIETSLKFKSSKTKNKSAKIEYKKDEIFKIIDNFKEKEIVIVLDNNYNKKLQETFENKAILNFAFPFFEDFLIETIEKLLAKNIKITMCFTNCDLISLYKILSILDYDIDLNITICPNSLMNPHIFEALKDEFKVNII